MTSPTFYGIRRLQPGDLPLLIEHHLRLDDEARRLRFGYALKNDVMEAQLRTTNLSKIPCWGLFAGERLVGSAMLVPLGKKRCEAAFTLEREWRGVGWGRQLMKVALEHAYLSERPKDVVLIHLHENVPMKRLTRQLPGSVEHLGLDVQKTVAIEEWGKSHFLMNTLMSPAEA
jgi:ribosomal protein S18 acetylase RimI-like enzyme